jgi:soluble lytic murein transglycosylase-like protein
MSVNGITRALSRVQEIQARIERLVGDAHRPPPAASEATTSFSETLDRVTRPSGVRPAPETLRPMIEAAAQRHNLSPELLEAVARRESAFNPQAVSPKGAQGLMQIMPGTQRLLGVTNPFDAGQSLDGGARYLRMMLDRFGGDVPKALAAYNAGPEAVARHRGIPPYAETQGYVSRILMDLGQSDRENEGE